MALPKDTLPLASLEEAITVLLCQVVDDAYRLINPRWRSHEPLKQLSDSEFVTLALLQQQRGF